MLVGCRTFAGGNTTGAMRQHPHASPSPGTQIRPSIPTPRLPVLAHRYAREFETESFQPPKSRCLPASGMAGQLDKRGRMPAMAAQETGRRPLQDAQSVNRVAEDGAAFRRLPIDLPARRTQTCPAHRVRLLCKSDGTQRMRPTRSRTATRAAACHDQDGPGGTTARKCD